MPKQDLLKSAFSAYRTARTGDMENRVSMTASDSTSVASGDIFASYRNERLANRPARVQYEDVPSDQAPVRGELSEELAARVLDDARFGWGVADKEVGRQIWKALSESDYTDAQKIGILANTYHESAGWREMRERGGGPGEGVFQFTSPALKNGYRKWLAANGLEDTPYAQTKYVIALNGDFSKAQTPWDSVVGTGQENTYMIMSENLAKRNGNTWSRWSHRGYTGDQAREDWNSGDPVRAARAFEGLFEKAGVPAIKTRGDYAATLWSKYLSGKLFATGGQLGEPASQGEPYTYEYDNMSLEEFKSYLRSAPRRIKWLAQGFSGWSDEDAEYLYSRLGDAGWDPRAVAYAMSGESNFRTHVKNPASSAIGLGQLTKAQMKTLFGDDAEDVYKSYEDGSRSVRDIVDDTISHYKWMYDRISTRPEDMGYGRLKVNMFAPNASLDSVISEAVRKHSLTKSILGRINEKSTYEDLMRLYDDEFKSAMDSLKWQGPKKLTAKK